MSIIGSLKRVLFGAEVAPVERAHNETASNPVSVILRDDNKPQETVSEPESITAGELQNAPMPSWMADVCDGLRFSVTLQLRTPLRVLLRHGEMYLKNDGQQPQIAREMWEGMWIPKSNFWKRLSVEPVRILASDVGPISAEDYLPFLIAVRTIVEANEPIEHRIEKLCEMLTTAEWQKFVNQRGPSHVSESTGADWIVDCFFPPFVGTIPKVPVIARGALSRLGLDTPNKLSAAPDETLLAIKGIGRATLQVIRDYCASIIKNRDADRLDCVLR